MENFLQSLNINLSKNQLEQLSSFKNLLLSFNKKYNLTSIVDDNEIQIKHFFDSLAGHSFFKNNIKAVEIGSGGGFPSIPLKIYRQDIDFTLVESVGKKCAFLQTAVRELNLSNVQVVNARAEDYIKLKRQEFDVVCARAVAQLNTLLEYCVPFIRVGGLFVAYKTYNKEEIDNAKNAALILGVKLKEVLNYTLPNNLGERSILVFEKIKQTPQKYPRGNGKERSNPL